MAAGTRAMISMMMMMMITAIAFSAMCTGVSGQAPAPAPAQASAPEPSPDTGMAPAPTMDCFTPLLNLSDCLTFVEVGSKVTKPDSGCCPGLKGLISSSPVCLCRLLADPSAASSFGIQIDRTRALSLPTFCKLEAPISLCALIGVPVGSPTSMGGSGSASSSPVASPPEKNQGTSNLFPISALAILVSLSTGVAAAIF